MLGKVFNFQLKKENQDLKSNKAGKDKKKGQGRDFLIVDRSLRPDHVSFWISSVCIIWGVPLTHCFPYLLHRLTVPQRSFLSSFKER